MARPLTTGHNYLTFAAPSPSPGIAHSESLLSASGFGIHPPGWLWLTAVNCGHLLTSLFGLERIKWLSWVCAQGSQTGGVGGQLEGVRNSALSSQEAAYLPGYI